MTLEEHRALGETLAALLAVAWLLPLVGFVLGVFGGYWQAGRTSRAAALLSVGCIAAGFVCASAALVIWGDATEWAALTGGHHDAAHAESVPDAEHEADAAHEPPGRLTTQAGHKQPFTGTFYVLARFGGLELPIDWYIDSLTLVMFVMVTLIATCIHVFALGYMSDELTDDHVDHQVHLASGRHLHRPGRMHVFFAYMSLFCFSMLGLVIAGNVFMVFIFWELVGICSYLLIGFYFERKSASTAANKAFIVNRVGDFGFLIGLMILWTSFGTLSFGDKTTEAGHSRPGLFSMVRGEDGELQIETATDGDRVVRLHYDTVTGASTEHPPLGLPAEAYDEGATIPYWLLVAAGLGVFAGCVGKSAQFPLQTWLPDAMEGPTPVSALVHSATMVAAGVYLAGRFYPMFTPEVLLVIAYVGCITLFLAATIAIVATDIKRVLAYSTISQLGYMMLAIGVAGWGAGLFHLVTHAFFKSLMFLASGSVIVACHHVQEMPRMGGLRRKMPITAVTMLVGVIAISGLAIPGTFIAFSGYHSKDAIVATALAYSGANQIHFLLFWVPLITAGITAFYMFRLWFLTFGGEARDQEIYDHAHETPPVMTVPLIVLALFAAFVALGGEGGVLYQLIGHSEPAGVAGGVPADEYTTIALPGHEAIAAVHNKAGAFALLAAFLGTGVAWVLYGLRALNPADIQRQFPAVHGFLANKWQFDEMYDAAFVRPVHHVAAGCAWVDRRVLDEFLHGACRITIKASDVDRRVDEGIVDGLVNWLAEATYRIGRSFRRVQTGRLRQYVMFIAVGVVALFVLLFAFLPKA